MIGGLVVVGFLAWRVIRSAEADDKRRPQRR